MFIKIHYVFDRIKKRGWKFIYVYLMEIVMFDIKYRVLTRKVKYNSRSADSVHYVPSFTTPIQDSVAFVLHNLVRKSKDYVFLDAGWWWRQSVNSGFEQF